MFGTIKRNMLFFVLFTALLLSCAKDDKGINAFVQALVVEIMGGPDEGGSVANNARFTFTWRTIASSARGGGASVSYQVQLSGVDASPISTTETSKTYDGQPPGGYTFTVTATAGSETATASRSFTVGANAGPPQIVVNGARGSASSGGSGATPAYAPGQTAKFNWTGEDPDKFGSITGYRWRIADTEDFNEFSLGTSAGFEVPVAEGVYTFTLEAMDNDGAVSTTTLSYEVKSPTILIVDDNPQGSVLDEIDEDGFYAAIFEGFAFDTWDIADQGVPTTGDLTPFEVAVLYGSGSSLWDDIGDDYPGAPVQLSEFADGGGKLWIMGQGLMEIVTAPAGPGNNHSNPPDPTEFEVVYLHVAGATGDTLIDPTIRWSRAGDFDGDLKFSFADNMLGDPVNFPRITMDVQSGDVDEIFADPGAEIIYIGKGGLQDEIGNVALRYPAGGTNTEVVFMTFPLFETASVKASLLNSQALTQEIMREMGQ